MAQKLTLPDGRNLDYSITGAPDGFPLFFLHGSPGSCVTPAGLEAACTKKGVMCITPSRAGYGGSSRKQGRKIADIVEDVEALKTHLGIRDCFVVGFSGGAVEEPPVAVQGEQAQRKHSEEVRKELLGQNAEQLEASLSERDRAAVLTHPEGCQKYVDQIREGFKPGVDGYVDDCLAFVKPWGFAVEEVKIPVFVWHGSADGSVPFSHGQWLTKNLTNAKVTAHLLHKEEHMSIFNGREEDVLDGLLESKASGVVS